MLFIVSTVHINKFILELVINNWDIWDNIVKYFDYKFILGIIASILKLIGLTTPLKSFYPIGRSLAYNADRLFTSSDNDVCATKIRYNNFKILPAILCLNIDKEMHWKFVKSLPVIAQKDYNILTKNGDKSPFNIIHPNTFPHGWDRTFFWKLVCYANKDKITSKSVIIPREASL